LFDILEKRIHSSKFFISQLYVPALSSPQRKDFQAVRLKMLVLTSPGLVVQDWCTDAQSI